MGSFSRNIGMKPVAISVLSFTLIVLLQFVSIRAAPSPLDTLNVHLHLNDKDGSGSKKDHHRAGYDYKDGSEGMNEPHKLVNEHEEGSEGKKNEHRTRNDNKDGSESMGKFDETGKDNKGGSEGKKDDHGTGSDYAWSKQKNVGDVCKGVKCVGKRTAVRLSCCLFEK